MAREPVEYIQLDDERRWRYLTSFYERAARFYGARDRIVDEAEIDAAIRAFKEKPAPRIRGRRLLTRWRFTLDPHDEGIRAGYYTPGHDETGWRDVRVPHSLNHVPEDPVRFGRSRYRILAPEPGSTWDIWKAEYQSWYKTRLDVGKLGQERVAYLSFDSVNLLADVWVNEAPVMMGHLGLFPFRMDVTEELDARDTPEAVIALRVSNHATNTPYLFYNGSQLAYAHPPYTKHPYPVDTLDQAWSGIAGPAVLDIMDRRHLDDVFLFTRRLEPGVAVQACRVAVRNETWRPFTGELRVEISPWLPREVAPRILARQPVSVLPLNDATVEVDFRIQDPALWTPDTPCLYLARVVLVDEAGKEIDDLCETFGVRTFRMRGADFYLNDRKVTPRGTHDLSVYMDESMISPSDRAIVRDILLHKRMNATCSRWPSDIRMHYGRIAEYADQLGYMISWTGYFEMWTIHPEAEVYADRDVPAMIRSLRNRPSVVIWEMGDEPLMEIHHHRRCRWYEARYERVAALDTSRPIIPAGFWADELVDLIERYPDPGLPHAARRRRVLEEYPLFTRENAPWDYHYCPYLATNDMQTTYHYIEMVRRCLDGERATVFTEFGIDGMPEPAKVEGVYGKHRWAGWGLMPVNRHKSDMNYYGRDVGPEDWKETQAAQALVMAQIIGRLRSHPEAFAAYYLVTMVDPWTFYWGMVDAAYNAKLAYFVARSCYARVHVWALAGSAVIRRADGPLVVRASNLAEPIRAAKLRVRVLDGADRPVLSQDADVDVLPGDGASTQVARVDVSGLSPDLYAVELRVTGPNGDELARTLELGYLVD